MVGALPRGRSACCGCGGYCRRGKTSARLPAPRRGPRRARGDGGAQRGVAAAGHQHVEGFAKVHGRHLRRFPAPDASGKASEPNDAMPPRMVRREEVQCLALEGLAMAEAGFPPSGATDCHVHVVGPKRRYPLPPEARYTPSDAPVGDLAAMLKRLGLERVVIVQPSFYGTDNACTLHAIADGLGMARGVAVLPDKVSADTIDTFTAQGIRACASTSPPSAPLRWTTIRRKIEAAARNVRPRPDGTCRSSCRRRRSNRWRRPCARCRSIP